LLLAQERKTDPARRLAANVKFIMRLKRNMRKFKERKEEEKKKRH